MENLTDLIKCGDLPSYIIRNCTYFSFGPLVACRYWQILKIKNNIKPWWKLFLLLPGKKYCFLAGWQPQCSVCCWMYKKPSEMFHSACSTDRSSSLRWSLWTENNLNRTRSRDVENNLDRVLESRARCCWENFNNERWQKQWIKTFISIRVFWLSLKKSKKKAARLRGEQHMHTTWSLKYRQKGSKCFSGGLTFVVK